MKKILISLSLLVLLSNCVVPFAGRQMIAYDPKTTATRIHHEKQGTLLLFGVLPIDSLLDMKKELELARTNNSCTDIKNIDISYYNQHYYIIGFEKLVVNADCVK